MARQSLRCRLGLHKRIKLSAFFTKDVICCERCPWAESPERAKMFAAENAIHERYRGSSLSPQELIQLVGIELTAVEALI